MPTPRESMSPAFSSCRGCDNEAVSRPPQLLGHDNRCNITRGYLLPHGAWTRMTKRSRVFRAALGLVCIASVAAGRWTQTSSQSSAFAQFVDRYLDDFARRHPSIAAGNGLHQHDDVLEDFSAPAIRAEVAALERDSVALSDFDPRQLSPDERVDRRILLGIIDG